MTPFCDKCIHYKDEDKDMGRCDKTGERVWYDHDSCGFFGRIPSMRIAKIDFPSMNSTDGVSVDVFVSGCSNICKGCQNPEIKHKDYGSDVPIAHLARVILAYPCHNVAIMGGEPLEQELLEQFLEMINKERKIWLYSGQEFKDVPEYILNRIHYLKTGPYMEKTSIKTTEGYPILSSVNQCFWRKENGVWRVVE